jgi:hypothetical protein
LVAVICESLDLDIVRRVVSNLDWKFFYVHSHITDLTAEVFAKLVQIVSYRTVSLAIHHPRQSHAIDASDLSDLIDGEPASFRKLLLSDKF